MKVAVIIVNYNQKNLLDKCLQSLEKVAYPDFRVYLMDNGSQDGSLEVVAGKKLDIKVIKMGYNSGFCKANNDGMKQALAEGYGAVILLNNDTEVEPDFIRPMVEKVNVKEKVGMVSSKVVQMRSPQLIDSTGVVITPDGLGKCKDLDKDESALSTVEEVFCPAGAAGLYTKELLEDIEEKGQYLDEDFTFYFEEIDLGWRVRLRGWKCLYAPEAKVYHLKSATAGAYSEFVAYYTNRNIFFNIVKNYPSTKLLKAVILTFFRYCLLGLGFFFNKGAGHKIKNRIGLKAMLRVTFKGLFDAARKMPKMWKKRKYIQSRRTVSREEVARWFKEMGISFFDSVYK